MKNRIKNKGRSWGACPSVVLGLTLASATSAHAEDNVFSLPELDSFKPFVSYAVTHDSNMFRLINQDQAVALLGTNDMSETIKQLGVGVNMDITKSRQRFVARVSYSHSKFSNFTFMDYTGRDNKLEWDWKLGRLWSGSLGYTESLSLSSYSQIFSVAQNLLTKSNRYFTGNYQIHPDWQLHLGANRFQVTNSASSQVTTNSVSESGEAGVNYTTPSRNKLGINFKTTNGRNPNQQSVSGSNVTNNYRQNDVTGLVDWAYSDKTAFNVTLGHVKRRYQDLPERDFSGQVGRARVNWNTTAKSLLSFSVWRELSAYDDQTSSYIVKKGLSFDPAWAPTSKLKFNGGWKFENQSYQGDPGFIPFGVTPRDDKVHTTFVGASYTPWRSTQIDVSLQTERRTSNLSTVGYDDNLIYASIRFDVQ